MGIQYRGYNMTHKIKITKAVVCPFSGLISPTKCMNGCKHFDGFDISNDTISCTYYKEEVTA